MNFTFEGRAFTARLGDSVAVALLGANVRIFRQTPVTGAGRAPFCMMGACFECLVEIDGEANVQACMTEIGEGMRIAPQQGARDLLAGTGTGP